MQVFGALPYLVPLLDGIRYGESHWPWVLLPLDMKLLLDMSCKLFLHYSHDVKAVLVEFSIASLIRWCGLMRAGRYFFFQFPIAAQILSPIRPLLNIYYGETLQIRGKVALTAAIYNWT